MRPMPELEVVKVPTEELVEYANNAKLHPAEQVDQIAASIEEFGFNSPILAWHNDDGEPEIVAGHGRLMAARKLGMEELPVVFLDHMDEEQRRAYILVDNQLTMNSGFDYEVVANELSDITNIDMGGFGFDLSSEEVLDEDEFEGQPEYRFATDLDHESNYVVLKFDKDIDWLWAQEIFGLEREKQFSTRNDGSDNGAKRASVGRVVNGVEAIRRLIGGGADDEL